ncbi:MAG: PAC2 family protein, partial [Acidimicrobiales bacterium]
RGHRWPEPRLDAATGADRGGGRDLLLLSGPEPDMRWHRFVSEVIGLSSRLGVELVMGLGAFPAPVPHTRPVRLAGTSVDGSLAQQVGVVPASIEVPAGAQGVLEHAFGQAGVPSLGLWARVPHYASALPYPAAAAALLDRLGALADVELDTASLHAAATVTAAHIDQLIAGSDEHAALVRQLELSHDEEAEGLAGIQFGDLPSGDEIAAELERFLRGER